MGRAGSIDPATRRSLNPASIRRPRPRRGVELTLEHGSITMVAPHCAGIGSCSRSGDPSERLALPTCERYAARDTPPVAAAVPFTTTYHRPLTTRRGHRERRGLGPAQPVTQEQGWRFAQLSGRVYRRPAGLRHGRQRADRRHDRRQESGIARFPSARRDGASQE
jgi:hypothetical protein